MVRNGFGGTVRIPFEYFAKACELLDFETAV
jgi:hypothetical protein